MTDFDDPFADRVREAFDAYEEPVDEAAWARMQAVLASGAGAPTSPTALGTRPARATAQRAGDRPMVASPRQRSRAFWIGASTLAALVFAAGIWLTLPRLAPEPEAPVVAIGPPQTDGASTEPEANAAQADRYADSQPAASGENRVAPEAVASASPHTAPLVVRESAPRPLPLLPATDVPSTGEPEVEPSAPLAPEVAVVPETLLSDMPATEIASPLVAPAPGPPLADNPSVIVREDVRTPQAPSALSPEVNPQAGRSTEVSLVAASTSAVTNGRLADGIGGAAGVVGEIALARGFSVSGGALAAYNRFAIDTGDREAPTALSDIQNDPSLVINVPDQRTLTTVALEIPLDVALHVLSTPQGQLGVSVGVTSAVYLAQTFDEAGQTYSADFLPGNGTGDGTLEFEAQSYTSRATPGPFSRIDLARQLNLALRFTSDRAPLAVEGYARLPLGGLTSQDLSLTTLGLRLRVALR